MRKTLAISFLAFCLFFSAVIAVRAEEIIDLGALGNDISNDMVNSALFFDGEKDADNPAGTAFQKVRALTLSDPFSRISQIARIRNGKDSKDAPLGNDTIRGDFEKGRYAGIFEKIMIQVDEL
jgi:hypothetical protein